MYRGNGSRILENRSRELGATSERPNCPWSDFCHGYMRKLNFFSSFLLLLYSTHGPLPLYFNTVIFMFEYVESSKKIKANVIPLPTCTVHNFVNEYWLFLQTLNRIFKQYTQCWSMGCYFRLIYLWIGRWISSIHTTNWTAIQANLCIYKYQYDQQYIYILSHKATNMVCELYKRIWITWKIKKVPLFSMSSWICISFSGNS